MKRFHSNVGSLQAALQQRPEILKAISVYATVHILNRMVYDLVLKLAVQTFVSAHFVGKKFGSDFDMLSNDWLQCCLQSIWNHKSTDVATALQESHDDSLIAEALTHAGDSPCVNVLVHVPR